MTTRVQCEPFTYVARSDERHPTAMVGWLCACGARCDRASFATRQAAIDDWAANHRGET